MTAAESPISGNGWTLMTERTLAVALACALRRLRAIMAMAVIVALTLAPLPLASAHDPVALAAAEMTRHAALQAEIAEHGHAHDDGEGQEQSSGHMHGHDPADHSHQTVFVTGAASHESKLPAQDWPSSLSNVDDPGTAFGIDRPPKHSVSC